MERTRRTDDGIYPNVIEERTKKDERARGPIVSTHDLAPAREAVNSSPETELYCGQAGAGMGAAAIADTERPVTLGIVPFVTDPSVEENLMMLIESCFMLTELARKEKLNYEDEIVARISKHVREQWFKWSTSHNDLKLLQSWIENGDWRTLAMSDQERAEIARRLLDSTQYSVIEGKV